MEYARRILRLLAWVIDLIVVLIITAIVGFVVGGSVFDEEVSIATTLIQGAITLGYFILLTNFFGATLGKMALGMRVVVANGERATLVPIVIREVLVRGLGTILIVVLGDLGGVLGAVLGFIFVFWILIDDKRQGIHDKIAGTFVVRAGS